MRQDVKDRLGRVIGSCEDWQGGRVELRDRVGSFLGFYDPAMDETRLELPVQDLAFWDISAHQYLVESGTYEIMLGASSTDLRLRAILTVK